MIDQARKLKYELVTLGDCLGDPPSNWYRDPVTGQPYSPVNTRPQAAALPVSAVPLSTALATPSSVAAEQFGAGTGAQPTTSSPSKDPVLQTGTPKNLARPMDLPRASVAALIICIMSVILTFVP